MYPSRYNDEHEMTRFFSFQFIASGEVQDDVDWTKRSAEIIADGVIYAIIPESEEDRQRVLMSLQASSRGLDRFIFVVPRHFTEIISTIAEYAAVAELRDKAVDDTVLFDEYEVVFDDLQEIIKGYIAGFTHPEAYQSIYIHDGEKLAVGRKSSLTELMSQICDRVYALTPVINNESVNKNEITSIAANSRNKVVGALLRGELESSLGLSGTGQEVSIMRSTLVRTGMWSENNGMIDWLENLKKIVSL